MEVDETYLQELTQQATQSKGQAIQSTNAVNSMFAANQDPNLIEWQLELDNILERIEHLLRGDTIGQDKQGNVSYIPAKNDDLKPLNEYGVQFLMNFLSFYLNRNTILSNYSEERIKTILYDIGYELTDQIYLNYEKMGLDTPQKQKRYAIIVLQLVHIIESAYNRAYQGRELDSLRTARNVMQSDPIVKNNPMPQMMTSHQKEFSFFSPKTWLR